MRTSPNRTLGISSSSLALYSFVDTAYSLFTTQKLYSNAPHLNDLTVVKELAQSKFPVYLVESSKTRQKYVMKLFPFKKGKPDHLFKNEAKNSFLSHPNIIRTHQVGFKYTLMVDANPTEISFTIQDFALHGDFFELVTSKKIPSDEKILRTFFHQLVEGVEYLHKNKIAHCDLKLENLLLNHDFCLQIADFDLSRNIEETITNPGGSPVYRAPELKNGCCRDLASADVYSLGIILFTMKTQGGLPFLEDTTKPHGYNLFVKLQRNPEEFWDFHCKMLRKNSDFFDEDFKELFISLTHLSPADRATLQDIKRSKWYSKEIYSLDELKGVLSKYFQEG